MLFILGDMIALLKYETEAQRRNVPIMLGVDGIQKIYGSNNNSVPPAITTLVRNIGLAFCQSATMLKVCTVNMKLIYYPVSMLIIYFCVIF